MASAKDTEDTGTLPDLQDGEMADVIAIEIKARKTKPPSHYTEGTILDDMKSAAKFVEDDPALKKSLKEALGLGTAATRAATIEGLRHDKYLEKKGKYLIATEKGRRFIHWLDTVAPELTDVAMTARWEAELQLVAQNGGGPAFEAKVEEFVKKLVTTLKAAPPIGLASKSSPSTSTEKKSMSDDRKPTDKMLEFAKSIAKRLNIRVPDEVMTDYEACKQFIDTNRDAALRPSEKQLSFAQAIAQRKGVTVPAECLANGRELSKWIDDNK